MRPAVAPVLVLLAALVAAVVLREAPADGYRVPAFELRDGTEWVVDDPDAAYHLRRAEIALASGSVPRFDRYLNHPAGSPIPWPPLSDGLFALVARAFAPANPGEGDPTLRGFSETGVESVLVHLPPVLGALAALAVAFAVFALTDASRARTGRLWAAALAAWIYAALPVSVWYGAVTRIDHHVLVALFLALHLAFVTWSLRAEELVDGVLGAMLAGLVAGLALATWLASGVFVAIAGVCLFLPVLGRDAARSKDAVRAGVLYFATAAVTTAVPAATSAWNAVQPGSLINLTDGVPRALAAAIVPFVAAGLLTRAGRSRIVRLVGAAAALVAVVLLLPGFVDGVREGFAWASRENQFMDVVGESRPLEDASAIASRLSLLAFAFPVAWALCLPSAFVRPDRTHLLVLGALLATMTLGQQRFGNSFAVPLACTFAVALHDGLARAGAGGSSFATRAWWGGMAACALALVPSIRSVFATTADEYADLLDWRAEVVGGLRWMREGTPSPGPFNAPEHPQDYGVLSSWSLGHLIEYHARRPTIATNFGSFVGADGFREAAAALIETRPEELARRMRALGARYVVVTPRMVADLSSILRVAGEDPSTLFERTPAGVKVLGARARRSALWRLALYDGRPATPYPGLELVHAARRVETPAGSRPRPGEPSGPVISIYRLTAFDGEAAPSAQPVGPASD
jgi:dolichyl-diphosphooligosaccharide--protein glycosyltransferase